MEPQNRPAGGFDHFPLQPSGVPCQSWKWTMIPRNSTIRWIAGRCWKVDLLHNCWLGKAGQGSTSHAFYKEIPRLGSLTILNLVLDFSVKAKAPYPLAPRTWYHLERAVDVKQLLRPTMSPAAFLGSLSLRGK